MRSILLSCILILVICQVHAQKKCPENIGFESGDFAGWKCGTGNATNVTRTLVMTDVNPISNRHAILAASNTPVLDMYGKFPVNCPNGSGYSIRLGNDQIGAEIERVSYTFTIPAGQDDYSIIYNYAVVFEDPVHEVRDQPKFTAQVYDENTGSYIGCSSFSFTASRDLPGFKQSPIRDSVFFKDWTPVTIKLSGYAGKTIRLEFTTFDCARGAHFGYAYIDVDQTCDSPVSGNTACTNADKMVLVAPFGFKEYRWYNEDFSQLLGQNGTLEFKPVPKPNTRYALEIRPYPDQGCIDTLYTTIAHSTEPVGFSLQPDLAACIEPGADLTAEKIKAGSSDSLRFSYFSDPELTKRVQVPKSIISNGQYYIVAQNAAGCREAKSISVRMEPLPQFIVEEPPVVYRPGTVDLTKTIQSASASSYLYTYWLDSAALMKIAAPQFIDQTGRYFIRGESKLVNGCITTKPINIKVVNPPVRIPNVFSPNADGVNDEWRIPELIAFPVSVVEVFDRSGRIVHRSAPGYSKPWDGRLNGQPLPFGVYYFIIRLNDELPDISGSITMLK
jgi:gliding motility-associated-like protein